MPIERAAIRKALERVTGWTGARLEALTVATFADFAMCFSDLVSTNRQPVARLISQAHTPLAAAQVRRFEGGFVSPSAHVGNWELASRLLAGGSARTTHVVVAEEESRALERWVRRPGDGVRFVTRARPTVSLELVAALRRAEVVAVQADRALGTRGDVLIPFFGTPAPFPLGPFLLAAAAGVPMVPAFCVLGADFRYTIKVAEPFNVERGGEEEAARAWVAMLEEVVRAYPTQWFNFFDFWNPRIS